MPQLPQGDQGGLGTNDPLGGDYSSQFSKVKVSNVLIFFIPNSPFVIHPMHAQILIDFFQLEITLFEE